MAYNIYTNHFHGQTISRRPVTESKITTNKETIRDWAEARNGIPVFVKDAAKEHTALSIQFNEASQSNTAIDKISWDKFFDQFDKNKLAMVYQEKKTSGETSTFYKLVNRDSQ